MLHKARVLSFCRENTESIKQTNALKILTLPMQTFPLNETLRLEKVAMLAWLSGNRGSTIVRRPKGDQRGVGVQWREGWCNAGRQMKEVERRKGARGGIKQ